jgi:hypothetical protein
VDFPPVAIFGPEPERDWCYLYQKAELARQQSDWDGVANLAQQAAEQGYDLNNSSSNTLFEWLPFVNGYQELGRYEEARQLSLEITHKDARMTNRLCTLWSKDTHPEAVDIWRELGCENPPN